MRGGSLNINSIKNSDFKYTVDENRKTWVRHIFPIGQYLISLIQAIPWKTYTWKGELPLWTAVNDGYVSTTVHVEADTRSIYHYRYIGGSVYEIIQNASNIEKNSVRDYIDPTGDIDVELSFPNITYSTNNISGQDAFVYHFTESKATPDNMNELVNNYTRWVFDNMKQQLQSISKTVFDNMFTDTIEFSLMEDKEGKYSDLVFEIGNIKLVRTIASVEGEVSGPIKIQLIAKFVGMSKSDHILEYILPVSNNVGAAHIEMFKNELDRFKNSTTILKGEYPIETYARLISGNIGAAKERISALNQPKHFWHKFYNHIARLQFLNTVLPQVMEKTDIKTVATEIGNLYYFIVQADGNNTLCKFDYTFSNKNRCNKADIVNKLVGNLRKILFVNGKLIISNRAMPLKTDEDEKLINKMGGKKYITVLQMDTEISKLMAASGGRRRTRKVRRYTTRKIVH